MITLRCYASYPIVYSNSIRSFIRSKYFIAVEYFFCFFFFLRNVIPKHLFFRLFYQNALTFPSTSPVPSLRNCSIDFISPGGCIKHKIVSINSRSRELKVRVDEMQGHFLGDRKLQQFSFGQKKLSSSLCWFPKWSINRAIFRQTVEKDILQ